MMKRTSVVLVLAGALVLVGCEEQVVPRPDEEPDPKGRIEVISDPSGARVFLDGSDTGRVTPYTIPDVPPGSHTIRLTLKDYQEWGPESVEVAADEVARIEATLELLENAPEPQPDPPAEYGLGLVPVSMEAYRNAPVLRADPVVSLPVSVDLSPDVPKPGNQGMQGSCVGWAVAYALKTYHERTERGWALNDYRHVMSPAYLYNQIKEPGGGAYFHNAFKVLQTQGVSSWALMPYTALDDGTMPSAAAIAEAANYRIAEWGTVLHPTHRDFIVELKRHLAAGTPVVIGIFVNRDFDALSESNPVYESYPDDCVWPQERCRAHALTIVGYSDRMSAFKFINSWGTNWGIGGYGWIDYEDSRSLIWEAYVTRDVIEIPDPEPPVAASDPSPADGMVNIAVGTKLSWTRNARTTSFDVYLGLNPALTAVDLQSKVAQPTFSPTLAPGTTYYWRVDARGAGGVTAGPVWSFTTVAPPPEPPVIITYPAPITFSSPSAAAETRTLSNYIRGATSYQVQASAAGVVTTRVAGHRLTVAPQATGTAVVRIQGTNEDGSSPWLSMNVTVLSPPPDPTDPPVIVTYPAPITFSSPSAAAQTRMLSDYIRGATRYEVQANPAGIVTTRVAGHRLTVAPQAAGTAVVRIRGTNEDGSSPWLSMNVTVASPPPDPPDPPVIIRYPRSITFASPTAAAQTIVLNTYIRGADTYDVNVTPVGIVTRTLNGHRLTIRPRAAGAATVQVRGNNGDGSSGWLPISVVVAAPPPDPEPPTIISALDAMTFASPAAVAQTVQLTRHVTGATSYRVTTRPTGVVRAAIVGERLTVTPLAAGNAVLTVTARNADGSVELPMSVVVNEPSPPPKQTTFGTQTISDVVMEVQRRPYGYRVNLPNALGDQDDLAYQMERPSEFYGGTPPGMQRGIRNGQRYMEGSPTAAHDPTTYAWVVLRLRRFEAAQELDRLTFTVTIGEGNFPVPRIARNDGRSRTYSISRENGAFWVSLPTHHGGKEPFQWTLTPSIPGCDPMILTYFGGGYNGNQFRCSVYAVHPGTWDLTYTVTDVHGDSDSTTVRVTFTP